MANKKFLHCLRIQFYPNRFEDERICEVVEYCARFGFNNVMLFINAEEYNVGHMTIEEAKPWIATIKKAKAALEERGISVSLNPWMELGHLDRCRPLKVGQNFTTQTDYDGNKCEMVACPLCQNWKKYFLEFYTYLIKEIKPDTVWIEDDFRLHNHGDLHFGGCFCDLHMRRYNERLNADYTREEFTDLLFRKKPNARVRRAWLDVNRECMVSLAKDIGSAIKELGLGVKVGLMSSMHEKHALEGRDWHGLHRAFAYGGQMINRLHLPCYNEISAKEYYLQFNRLPFHCRALLPEKTVIYPELENGSFNTFTKDARFLRFQLESAIPLCINGMTYDIYDFVGNGIVHGLRYGEAISEITPYLNGVMRLGLKYNSLEGVILPIDEKTVYKRKAKITRFNDLTPDESHFNAYLTSIGLACKPSTQKKFVNKIVALGGGNAYNFTKKQLCDLFANNFVILEGGAARILIDRNLGYLFGASGYKTYLGEHDVHSYEEVASGVKINGKLGYRATAFGKAGDYVKIDYFGGLSNGAACGNGGSACAGGENACGGALADGACDEACAWSFVYDYLGNKIGAGAVSGKNFFVIPYVINGVYFEQYHDLRVALLKRALPKNVPLVYTNHAGTYVYNYKKDYKKGKKNVLITVNGTEEDFEVTNLRLQAISFSRVRAVDRVSGKLVNVEYEFDGENLTLKTQNEHLTTQTFVLE